MHHLVFDGFALRFLSETTSTRYVAESDAAIRDDYQRHRTPSMLDEVRRVVSTPLFSAEMSAASRACAVYEQRSFDAPPSLHRLIERLSKDLATPLADAFYAVLIVCTLQAAGLASGPFLLTDNCRDSSNATVFGMVQREYGCIFEHGAADSFTRNVQRAACTMSGLSPVYRRLFSE